MTYRTLTSAKLVTTRKRLVQMHFESGVGHLGGNLSALDAMLLVFHEYIGAHDKFILSKGHSAGALYICLWSIGRIKESDLKLFHKDNTLLAGHPPANGITDIPFATGSLGHGLSLAAGTALAFRLKSKAAKVICMTSDGEWQEGSTWEALIFASHHKLSNLTVLIDHNDLQGFGSTTEVASMSPLSDKLQGFNIDLQIIDGHSLNAMRKALSKPSDFPKVIVLNTVKGHGIKSIEGRMDSHYLPPTDDQYLCACKEVDSV